MIQTIHQLYCTHCTYGTSALHRRDGAMKDHAFEYSARAASVPQNQSHDSFRQVEPYMYYRLPGDVPADQYLKYNAGNTRHLRRLVYFPSIGGLRVVAHICYRTTDTRNRPGSYFAHVLFSEATDARGKPNNSAAWSAADCLKLWDAPQWVVEDAADLAFDLPPLESLLEFNLQSADVVPVDDSSAASLKRAIQPELQPRVRRPAIDDEVLLGFLTAPPAATTDDENDEGDPFHDPAHVVPPRWREKPVGERQQLLIDTLQAFLELDHKKRESVLLVIEPSMAALVFYGIARLLPTAGVGEQISFSTFESHTDRPRTALAATTFEHPDKTDLPREAYHPRGGFVFNTYNGKRMERQRHQRRGTDNPVRRASEGTRTTFERTDGQECPSYKGGYANLMVGLLVEEHHGWQAVHRILQACDALGATEPGELEEIADSYESIESYLDPQHEPLLDSMEPPRSDKARCYVRQAVAARITAMRQHSAEFQRTVADSAHLFKLLRLLAVDSPQSGATDGKVERAAQQLLDVLPPDRIADLLDAAELAPRHKLSVLARYVEEHQQLPAGCERLWNDTQTTTPSPVTTLRDDLFRRLSDKALQALVDQFLASEPGERDIESACRSLLNACAVDGRAAAAERRDKQDRKCDGPPTDKRQILAHFLEHPWVRGTLPSLLDVPDVRLGLLEQYHSHPQRDVLAARLSELLNGLPESGSHFSTNLQILETSRERLTESQRTRLHAWLSLDRCFQEIDRVQQTRARAIRRLFNGKKRARELNALVDECGDAALLAMPNELRPDDPNGRKRAKEISDLALQQLQAGPLPDQFATRLEERFHRHTSPYFVPPVKANVAQRRRSSRIKSWLTTREVAVAAAVVLLLGAVALLMYDQFRTSDVTPPTPTGPVVARRSNSPAKTGNGRPTAKAKKIAAANPTPAPPDAPALETEQKPEGPSEPPKTASDGLGPTARAKLETEIVYVELPPVPAEPDMSGAGPPRPSSFPLPDIDGARQLKLHGLASINRMFDSAVQSTSDFSNKPVATFLKSKAAPDAQATPLMLVARPSEDNREIRLHLEETVKDALKGSRPGPPVAVFAIDDEDQVQFSWNYVADESLRGLQEYVRLCVLEADLGDGKLLRVALQRPRSLAKQSFENGVISLRTDALPPLSADADLVLTEGRLNRQDQPDRSFSFGKGTVDLGFELPGLVEELRQGMPFVESVHLRMAERKLFLDTRPRANDLRTHAAKNDETQAALAEQVEPLKQALKTIADQELPLRRNLAQGRDPGLPWTRMREAYKLIGSNLELEEIPKPQTKSEERKLLEGISTGDHPKAKECKLRARARIADSHQEISRLQMERESIQQQIDALDQFYRNTTLSSGTIYRLVDGEIDFYENKIVKPGIPVKVLVIGEP